MPDISDLYQQDPREPYGPVGVSVDDIDYDDFTFWEIHDDETTDPGTTEEGP